MDSRIVEWLMANTGKVFSSPRVPAFGSQAQDFELVEVDTDRELVKIRFIESKYSALPLHFWMFDRTLKVLAQNEGELVRLGAMLQGPYESDTVEGQIWMKPYPTGKSSYKVSPHICDILVLAGFAGYGYAVNPSSERKVQAVRYIGEPGGGEINSSPYSPKAPYPKKNRKEEFLKKYRDTIEQWTAENKDAIIEGRRTYSWNNKSLIECINERNNITRLIMLSRIENHGGIDLDTLDELMDWGGFGQFPLRDSSKVLNITSEALSNADKGKVQEAIYKLLSIYGVGISRASKIIGLMDQDRFCIYDSRVGTALRTLKHEDSRIILCPPGRSRRGDMCSKRKWAENYEKLLWTLEIMRNYLNLRGYPFRTADVEMALFMIART